MVSCGATRCWALTVSKVIRLQQEDSGLHWLNVLAAPALLQQHGLRARHQLEENFQLITSDKLGLQAMHVCLAPKSQIGVQCMPHENCDSHDHECMAPIDQLRNVEACQ